VKLTDWLSSNKGNYLTAAIGSQTVGIELLTVMM